MSVIQIQGNPMARVKTILPTGVEFSQEKLAEMIYARPTLTYSLQAPVEGQDGRVFWVEYEIDFQVDPKKVSKLLMSRLQATRERISVATRVLEQVTARTMGTKDKYVVTEADLPDRDLLTRLYEEQDDAANELLIAAVVVDHTGRTKWGYVGPDGAPVNLTKELLLSDVRLAEAIQKAFNEWLFSSRRSSEGATVTNAAEKSSTATTQSAAIASSAASPTNSIASEKNGMTTGAAISPIGSEPFDFTKNTEAALT